MITIEAKNGVSDCRTAVRLQEYELITSKAAFKSTTYYTHNLVKR